MNFNKMLMEGAREGDVDKVREALKNGADIASRDGDKSTPLHWSVFNGHLEEVKELLIWGANPNTTDMFGRTPLHVAAFSGDVKVTQALLERNAEVNIMDNSNSTPLNHALLSCSLEIVEILKTHIKSQEKPKVSIELTEEQLKKVKSILGEI
jgi:ankyrin repeat protein